MVEGLPRFGLGCAPLGGLYSPVSDEAARAAIDAAWDAGVRFFDTAPQYGVGLAERRVGAALASRRGHVLSTKVGRLVVAPGEGDERAEHFAGRPPAELAFDFSRDGVLRSLAASLERLGRDRVDVVHVHDPDAPEHLERAIAETVPALAALRGEGVIGAVGAGMNDAAPLARLVREADVDCVLVAGRWTLLDQSAAEQLLPLCAERGVGVLAAGIFNSGIFADPAEGATYDYEPAPPALLARARRMAALCRRHGTSLPAAALAFARRHPAVTSVVVGARSPEEVAANCRAFEARVPDALWRDLDAEGLLTASAATRGRA